MPTYLCLRVPRLWRARGAARDHTARARELPDLRCRGSEDDRRRDELLHERPRRFGRPLRERDALLRSGDTLRQAPMRGVSNHR